MTPGRTAGNGVGVVCWHDPGCGGVWASEEVGMAMRVRPETGEVGLKQRYRVTNWSEYDRALVNRGNLTIWFATDRLAQRRLLDAHLPRHFRRSLSLAQQPRIRHSCPVS